VITRLVCGRTGDETDAVSETDGVKDSGTVETVDVSDGVGVEEVRDVPLEWVPLPEVCDVHAANAAAASTTAALMPIWPTVSLPVRTLPDQGLYPTVSRSSARTAELTRRVGLPERTLRRSGLAQRGSFSVQIVVRAGRYAPESVLFVLALGARLLPEILHGGVTGNYGYDASVYYAAADAFVHGRMPYRDFVLLHPPGVMLADAPFAALGSLTSDPLGFAAANTAFAILGALSAVLVSRVAQLLGLPRRAALAGGVVYALWFGSIAAEFDARLEPIGCLLVLCGLLAMLHGRVATRARRLAWLSLVAGLAFGAAISVKIWWLVPVAVIIGWQLVVERAPRRAGLVALGALVSGLLIDGPFLLAARGVMWRMVVLDQLGRPAENPTLLRPFGYMTLGGLSAHVSHTVLVVAVFTAAGVFAVLALRAWRHPRARLVVVVFAVQLTQIAVDPSWFTFYADFVTVSLSLLVAAAIAPAPARAKGNDGRVGWWAPGLAIALVCSLVWTIPRPLITGFPSRRMSEAGEVFRCVVSDSPMALIDMDVLSHDYHDGCPDLVDVTGLDYDLVRGLQRDQYPQARVRWNAYMRRYLLSGNAVLLLRPPRLINLMPATTRAIEQNAVVARDDGFTLYRVDHPTVVGAAPR